MPRLSKFSIVIVAQRIALAVLALVPGPVPVLIPIPVATKRETQMTRRIR